MKTGARLMTAVVVAAALAGCGGGFKVGKSWDPGESRLFDDGIDVVENMSSLSGKWEFDMKNELDARVNLADTVAIVEVTAVQTNEDLDGIESRKLNSRVIKVLYGETPGDEVGLHSTQESLGYSLITRHEARLVDTHIAFIRWFDGEDGKLANHFHLSPASPQLVKAVKEMIETREEEEKAQGVAR